MNKNNKYQLLADMAATANRVEYLLNVGRGKISREKLHLAQAKKLELDTEFIDVFLDSTSNSEQEKDMQDIAKAVAAAKEDLVKKGKITTSLTGTSVVINPPEDEPAETDEKAEVIAKLKKAKKVKNVKPNSEE